MPITLADLSTPLESVVLPSTGREVPVYPMNGVVAQLRQRFQETEDHALLWPIAAELVPDATPDEIAKLGMAHVMAIIAIASGRADQILAEIIKEREKEGNPQAPAKVKPEARRRRTGSAS